MMYAEFADSFPDSENFGLAVVTKNTLENTEGKAAYYSVRFGSGNEAAARENLYANYGLLEYIPRSANP